MKTQALLLGGTGSFTAYEAIQNASLTTNLVLCLDAGDPQSYTSGTKWLDRSGNGYDFDITGATFTGAAGARSSYFALDGASYFTYDSANEAWMNNMHKDNALFTLIAFYRPAAITSTGICGTNAGDDTTNVGIIYDHIGGPQCHFMASNGTAAVYSNVGLTAATLNAWNMKGISINEAGGAVSFDYTNGVDGAAFDAAYTAPSSSAATYVLQIAATGNNVNPLVNGSRFGIFMAWSGTALTAANMDSLWTNLRGRYGI